LRIVLCDHRGRRYDFRLVGTEKRRLWHRPTLSTRIFLLQLALIVLTVGAGVAVSIYEARDQLDRQTGQQSLAIARTVASVPEIRRAFATTKPWRVIDPIAERIRHRTGASFIVVGNLEGIRYSHPDRSKIGKRVSTDPSVALNGGEYVGVQTGTLGESVRAKVPLRGDGGEVIGFVSVGVLEKKVSAQLRQDLPVLLIPPAIGLALGALGSLLLARRIKRHTFGLEPEDIASLLEQREAVLHGIREGVVATDTLGRVTLANDEARRLLDLRADAVGRRLAELAPPGYLREVLAGEVDASDEVVLANDRVLVVNRMPVSVRGKTIGAVATLRDRTELEGVLRELDNVRNLAQALRAQEHEFSNRLHVIAGLLELGRHEEAMHFIEKSSLVHQALVASIVDSVADPVLAALLLGKAAVASERGVELRIGEGTRFPEDAWDTTDLVTVIGNLVDNALEAVASERGGGWVEVTVRDDPDGVTVRVHDSGPGVDRTLVDEIFEDGFTTKVARGKGWRGLGLALVSQAVRRNGGTVQVENRDGAVFTAFIPHAVREPAGAGS
jgi:two-component system CitB family sensor kinase